jgi:hypothetical protein
MTEKNTPKDIELVKVNRNTSDWDPMAQFDRFEYRVVLIAERNIIKSIMRKTKLEKMLKDNAGQENIDWIIKYSPLVDGEDEIYFKNSMFLLTWKMSDLEDYKANVSKIEEHDDLVEAE